MEKSHGRPNSKAGKHGTPAMRTLPVFQATAHHRLAIVGGRLKCFAVSAIEALFSFFHAETWLAFGLCAMPVLSLSLPLAVLAVAARDAWPTTRLDAVPPL
jgi:hypothetical protein